MKNRMFQEFVPCGSQMAKIQLRMRYRLEQSGFGTSYRRDGCEASEQGVERQGVLESCLLGLL